MARIHKRPDEAIDLQGVILLNGVPLTIPCRLVFLTGEATEDTFAPLFDHFGNFGVWGGGTIKNTGAENLVVRRTGTDAFGTVKSDDFTVIPGEVYSWSLSSSIDEAVIPFMRYRVAVKSETPGLPTTFDLRHSSMCVTEGVGGIPGEPPLPSCLLCDIFTDCFTGTSGGLPVDGWADTPLAGAGTTTFDDDKMLQEATSSFADAFKDQLITPTLPLTMQFRFTEGLGESPAIQVVSHRDTGATLVKVSLNTAGSVVVEVLGQLYSGAYTAAPGLTRTVHLQVPDGVSTPTLHIDGLAVALTPSGSVGGVPDAAFADKLSVISTFAGGQGDVRFDWIFVKSGVHPPSTVFCCPGGNPSE